MILFWEYFLMPKCQCRFNILCGGGYSLKKKWQKELFCLFYLVSANFSLFAEEFTLARRGMDLSVQTQVF